jgi:hypothetical protein
MEQRPRSTFKALKFSEGLVVVFVGFVLGFGGYLLRATDPGSASAFAALAAAVVGIGGALIGQATCILRAGADRLPKHHHFEFDVALFVICALALSGAVVMLITDPDRSAAAATLGIAALGAAVHLGHEWNFIDNWDFRAGLALIGLG